MKTNLQILGKGQWVMLYADEQLANDFLVLSL